MGRVDQVRNFYKKNSELFDKSRKRLFVDLYGTGEFELEMPSPQISSRGVYGGVLEQLLVMKRKNSTHNTKYTHILPLIDISQESQQVTSGEIKQLLKNTNPNSSLAIIPHSYYDYLSDEFWEYERGCVRSYFDTHGVDPEAVVYSKKHMRVLQQLYGSFNFPFLVQGSRSTYIESVFMHSARDSVFAPLFGDREERIRKIADGELEDDPFFYSGLQQFRSLKQISSHRRMSAPNVSTRSGFVKGLDNEVFYERFYDCKLNINDRETYKSLKKEAAEFCTPLFSSQGSLF